MCWSIFRFVSLNTFSMTVYSLSALAHGTGSRATGRRGMPGSVLAVQGHAWLHWSKICAVSILVMSLYLISCSETHANLGDWSFTAAGLHLLYNLPLQSTYEILNLLSWSSFLMIAADSSVWLSTAAFGDWWSFFEGGWAQFLGHRVSAYSEQPDRAQATCVSMT